MNKSVDKSGAKRKTDPEKRSEERIKVAVTCEEVNRACERFFASRNMKWGLSSDYKNKSFKKHESKNKYES